MLSLQPILHRVDILQNRNTPLALVFAGCLVGLVLCREFQAYDTAGPVPFVRGALLLIVCVAIFIRPLWGLVVVSASLPVGQLFPDVPYATSVFPIFGGMMVAGFISASCAARRAQFVITLTHCCALLFILWIVSSNPVAAISMGDRVWLWTFVQLLILMFIATQLVREDGDHQTIMWAFVATSILSALYAIQQVKFGITSADSVRASGLSYGANEAGKWFVMAIVLLVHLRRVCTQRWRRFMPFVAIAVLMAGLAATVSRTSFLLLFIGFLLMAVERISLVKERLFEFSAALIAATLFLIPSEYWHIISGILSSIVHGSDSAGFRYMQWDAGLAMWGDHPVAGVGIGQFEANTAYYGYKFLPFYGLRWAAHNTYITLLAETGVVGFVLFLSIVVVGLVGLLKAPSDGSGGSSPHYAWMTALVVLLVGGLTGDDHAHKLVWMILGIGGIHLARLRFGEHTLRHTRNEKPAEDLPRVAEKADRGLH